MADNREAIERLEEVLTSGVRSVSVDGTSTTFSDDESIRRSIERLKQEDTTGTFTSSRRVKRIDLSGF